jgi:hypothetical protein
MMKIVAAALLAFMSWSGAVCAQQGPQPAVQEYQGVRFVTGGIGEEERAAILAASADFNLKLLFAEKGGAYLADVTVVVTGADGAKVLELKADGPLVLASLPVGAYRVAATAGGREQVRSASIPATGQRSLAFYW